MPKVTIIITDEEGKAQVEPYFDPPLPERFNSEDLSPAQGLGVLLILKAREMAKE